MELHYMKLIKPELVQELCLHVYVWVWQFVSLKEGENTVHGATSKAIPTPSTLTVHTNLLASKTTQKKCQKPNDESFKVDKGNTRFSSSLLSYKILIIQFRRAYIPILTHHSLKSKSNKEEQDQNLLSFRTLQQR